MASRVWTVRIVQPGNSDRNCLPGLWIEQLRYAGLLRVLKQWDGGVSTTEVLELQCCQKGVDTKVWAEQNAQRMRSFGINAAAAPMWGSKPEDKLFG